MSLLLGGHFLFLSPLLPSIVVKIFLILPIMDDFLSSKNMSLSLRNCICSVCYSIIVYTPFGDYSFVFSRISCLCPHLILKVVIDYYHHSPSLFSPNQFSVAHDEVKKCNLHVYLIGG